MGTYVIMGAIDYKEFLTELKKEHRIQLGKHPSVN
jgi:hypothetical protein